ncbi:MAG: hypothetical protein AAF211_30635 [Myxococcota bacterium]
MTAIAIRRYPVSRRPVGQATAAWATGAPWLGEAMGASVALRYVAVMIHSLSNPDARRDGDSNEIG